MAPLTEPALNRWHAQYLAWRATSDGELVYGACRRAALRLRRRGFRRYAVSALFEAARWLWAVRIGPDVDGWRLNSNYTPYLARELMASEPDLAGFFALRELRA